MRNINFRAMGCGMTAMLDAHTPVVDAALANVPAWFERWEQSFSRFRPDSELSQLNRARGWQTISTDLCHVIDTALLAAEWGGGLVVPNLLNALELTGYDESFERLADSTSMQQKNVRVGTLGMARTGYRSAPSQSAKPETGTERDATASVPYDQKNRDSSQARNDSLLADADWREIKLDPRQSKVWLPEGMRLDLGGIAKGWAAQHAAQMLGITAPALVDAGGDIAISGPRIDSEPWVVAVDDPRSPESNEPIELLLLQSGGVATSGRNYRHWMHNGAMQHHIIDPRTGLPAQTDVLSATVVAPSAVMAEIAAKAVLILGSDDGLTWIESNQLLAALLVRDDGTIVHSSRLAHSGHLVEGLL